MTTNTLNNQQVYYKAVRTDRAHYATLMAPMEATRAVMREEEDDDTRDSDRD